ncbi:hypothetical protein Csa_005148 [Cucumis sativus]|uniref:Uncharacterized protein n=1 Tax=Cucumis sativus TaxID=3659 RepID=A0A0A0K8W0_CUCSA|nr:hypothetical protein Csa_005148 [Cucumis sativus]
MGGSHRQKKTHSSFSIFSFFKSKRGRKGDVYEHGTNWEDVPSSSKVWPSDEDKGYRWVAEPGIDRKAKDYIDRIYKNRVFETERQTVTIHPNGPNSNV